MNTPLFAIDPLPLQAVPELPTPKVTERTMLNLLRKRYGKVDMGAHRYAIAEHVPNTPVFPAAVADFIALDCWRNPSKAEAWKTHCDYWWLVVPDASIVRDDLPEGWGLLVLQGNGLRAVKRAPKLDRQSMTRPMSVALLRAVAKTARAAAPEEKP